MRGQRHTNGSGRCLTLRHRARAGMTGRHLDTRQLEKEKMELSQHGTITIDGCKARRNAWGKWDVSRSGIHLGEVDSLAEVASLIERRKDDVRQRLARIEADAPARKDGFSM